MKTLDANRININSPYKVWTEGEVVHFVTDYGIQYAVDFDYDGNPYYTAYWLNLTNESSKPSPSDKKIPQTVISSTRFQSPCAHDLGLWELGAIQAAPPNFPLSRLASARSVSRYRSRLSSHSVMQWLL